MGAALQPLRSAGEAQRMLVGGHVVGRNLLVDKAFEQETGYWAVRMIGLMKRQQRGAVRLFLETVVSISARPERLADGHIPRDFIDAGLGDRLPRSGLPTRQQVARHVEDAGPHQTLAGLVAFI